MSQNWNTRKFAKQLGKSFFKILNDISDNEQILVVQKEVLPIINALFTFTQLTESTLARKIVLISEQLENEVSEILSTFPGMDLVFVIDARLDLAIPRPFKDVAKTLKLPVVNVVFCSWETQSCNALAHVNQERDTRIPHFIESQLETAGQVRLMSWNMLPFPQIDDNVLVANVLYNSEKQNMYSPSESFMQTATRSILLDNMVNCLHTLLNQTETTITNVVAMGTESWKLTQALRQRVEAEEDSEKNFIKETLYGDKYSGLETDLLVVERDMDPMTPLLTQLTYAGLVDDLYEFTPDAKTRQRKELSLKYAEDEVWQDLKFLNFGDLGSKLNVMAKNSDERYASRPKTDNLGELKQFVDAIPELQESRKLINKHIDLSAGILNEVENEQQSQFNRILELEQNMLSGVLDNRGSCDNILNLIYEGQLDSTRVVRLACLLSLCRNGFRDKDYELMKQELVDAFGIDICFQLERLASLGLFTSKSLLVHQNFSLWKKEYRNISYWLDTLPPAEDRQDSAKGEPRDASFAYCGVVPLSTRLIQMVYDRTVLSKNYNSQQPFIISRQPNIAKTAELISQIYGSPDFIHQESWMSALRKNKRRVTIGQPDPGASDIVLLVFLGGVTMGEIATLKFLQDKLRQKEIYKRFIIVSDGVTNGNRITNSSIHPSMRVQRNA
ncbi:VPS33 (YLR396C) [Zygosaccharomyces parabailii]|nr:VPS33 (YLR396C) [Zygosaccharomyces parabailii]CDH10938.1 related to Vacuolar protein sorting-associated protein 33 [Zygosaccharomyces bailii ISA1307]